MIISETKFYFDIVESPDDGGWYAYQTQKEKPFDTRNLLSSKAKDGIFPDERTLREALKAPKLRWSKWS